MNYWEIKRFWLECELALRFRFLFQRFSPNSRISLVNPVQALEYIIKTISYSHIVCGLYDINYTKSYKIRNQSAHVQRQRWPNIKVLQCYVVQPFRQLNLVDFQLTVLIPKRRWLKTEMTIRFVPRPSTFWTTACIVLQTIIQQSGEHGPGCMSRE